ncbi:hypothetical protein MKX03_024858 [Papaver bracteatum]|nr:hypothetical protein MKX03_024858 [Papaver bracteatum]
MRGVATFNLFCERFVCPTTPMSHAPYQNPIPTSCSDKNPTTVQARGPRVVSPVLKDARAKKYFEGSQAGVKQKKSKLWKQAITGVRQIFYNGVREVRNVVAIVCFENGHDPDSEKRKSETSRYTVRCKNWKTVMRYVKDHTCGAGYRESKSFIPLHMVYALMKMVQTGFGTRLLFDVPKVFPDAYHSYCYYHMKQKIHVHGDDQLYPHVLNHWRHDVYSLTECGYNTTLKALIDLECGHVVRWMEKQGP